MIRKFKPLSNQVVIDNNNSAIYRNYKQMIIALYRNTYTELITLNYTKTKTSAQWNYENKWVWRLRLKASTVPVDGDKRICCVSWFQKVGPETPTGTSIVDVSVTYLTKKVGFLQPHWFSIIRVLWCCIWYLCIGLGRKKISGFATTPMIRYGLRQSMG